MKQIGIKPTIEAYLNDNPAATRSQIVQALGFTGKQVDNALFRIGTGWQRRVWGPKQPKHEFHTLQSVWR